MRQSNSKVSEFLAELSPMRGSAYWHDFIAKHLHNSSSTESQSRGRRLSAPSIPTTLLTPNYVPNNYDNNFQPVNNNNIPISSPDRRYSSLQRPSAFIQNTLSVPYYPSAQRRQQEYSSFHHDSYTAQRDNVFEISLSNVQNKPKPPVPPKPIFLNQNLKPHTNNPATFSVTTTQPKMQVTASPIFPSNTQQQHKQQTPQRTFRAPSLVRRRSESILGANNSRASPGLLNRANSIPDKPHYNSSSFYDPRTHPTIEQQVILCREIAKQLVSDASNAKSKGREMFERRVEKSAEWVTTESINDTQTEICEDFHERTISDGPVNLRKLLDPRHVEDINTVPDGVNEHLLMQNEDTTRDTCKNIVQDLLSPEVNPNRGNTLFARRAQQSNEWIVDEVAEGIIDAAKDKVYRNMIGARSVSPSMAFATLPKTFPDPEPAIPGPVFDTRPPHRTSLTPEPKTMAHQFRDFNARIKPFFRVL